MKKNFLVCFILLFAMLPVFGSHLTGVDVRTQYAGGSLYDVYVTQYMDCQGLLTAPVVTLTGVSGCSGPVVNPAMVGGWVLESNEEISNVCSGTLTTCNGGAAPGIRKVVHRVRYDFTGVSCTKYQVAYNHCCWNGALSNISNPNLSDVSNWVASVDLSLNGNSSPDFVFDNPAYLYANASNLTFNIDIAASDPDMDSLGYAIVSATGSGGTSLTYNAGFSGTNPLGPGWTCALSGTTLTCTNAGTPSLGNYVIAVKALEYRNGVVTGEIMRMFTISIVSAAAPVCNYCQAGFAVQNIFQNCSSGTYVVTLQDYSVAASGTGTPSYLIDYGDGSALSASFNHTYVTPGIYPVEMYYDNGNGCQDTVSTFVNVNNSTASSAQADFLMNSSTVCLGTTIAFMDNSNNCPTNPIISWVWSFGDGNTSMQQNPVHTYVTPGTYIVELFVTYQDGSTSVSYGNLSVSPPPVTSASLTPAGPYTVGDTITATGSASGGMAPYAYNWSLSSNLTNLTGPFGSPVDIEVTGPGNSTIIHCVADAMGCTSCDTINFVPQSPPPPSCTITGSVYLATNPPTYVLADSFDVFLIQYDGTTQLLSAIDTFYSQGNPAGGYTFLNVPAGSSYRLKAALRPTSVYYANYLPSYFVNNFQSALYWNQADSIIISNPCTGPYSADVVLPAGSNPGGPGFIGGYVYQGANKMTDTALVDIEVILLNQQMQPVAYDYTDVNGYFSFSGLAYGTYYLYVEMLNTSCTPLEVTISGLEPSVETEFNVVEQNITGVMTAIDEFPAFLSGVSLFPNPNTGTCSLSLTMKQTENLTVTVTDVMDRTVMQETRKVMEGKNDWKLDTGNLPQGVYTLSVSGSNQSGVRIRMIKN